MQRHLSASKVQVFGAIFFGSSISHQYTRSILSMSLLFTTKIKENNTHSWWQKTKKQMFSKHDGTAIRFKFDPCKLSIRSDRFLEWSRFLIKQKKKISWKKLLWKNGVEKTTHIHTPTRRVKKRIFQNVYKVIECAGSSDECCALISVALLPSSEFAVM